MRIILFLDSVNLEDMMGAMGSGSARTVSRGRLGLILVRNRRKVKEGCRLGVFAN